MKEVGIMYFVFNILLFSLPFTWYTCYQMYKDLKKKDKVIALLEKILKEKTR